MACNQQGSWRGYSQAGTTSTRSPSPAAHLNYATKLSQSKENTQAWMLRHKRGAKHTPLGSLILLDGPPRDRTMRLSFRLCADGGEWAHNGCGSTTTAKRDHAQHDRPTQLGSDKDSWHARM